MKKRIKELEKQIKSAQNAYYNSDTPIMSDEEFDALWEELMELDPDNELFSEVGNDHTQGFEKSEHNMVMGSQRKANTREQMKKFFSDNGDDYIVDYKLDGISLEVNYEKGKLISCITRGDGFTGDEITSNAIKMNGFPKKLSKPFNLSARGEILLSRKNRKKYFPDMKNCRNAASGISKRLDGTDCEYLDVVFYDVQFVDKKENFKTQVELHNWLKKEGFKVVTWQHIQKPTSKKAMNLIKEIFDNFDNLEYDIDGLVWKKNKIDQKDLKNLRPLSQIALKPANVEKKTKLLDIVWEQRNGTFTPIAILKPIDLLGSTVSRASLCNLNEIERLGIKPGDYVMVAKMNMVIPKITRKVA